MMRFRRSQFLLTLALAACLHLALAVPAQSRVYYRSFVKAMSTGNNVRVTTDTTIFSRKVTIQNPSSSAAVVYVGDSTLSGSANAFCVLAAGQSITLSPSKFHDERGEQFRLADWYLRGTTGDTIYVLYELRG